MKKTIKTAVLVAALGFLAQPTLASDSPDGAKLFDKKCKMCHKIDKKSMGPAVNTMNSDAEALRSAIANGKNRMPSFGKKFSADEIEALVTFIQAQK